VPAVVDPAVPPVAGRVARTLDELRDEPSVFDDLHVEARRVLDRNPEPRNLRDVAVALESMGYTPSQARTLGFDSVFDLALAVFDLAYLYWVPREVEPAPPRNTWRTWVADYLAGSWYGLPWILSLVVLFVGKVALWSSLEATPQVSAVVSLAFFLAAALAGATSQLLARKGAFYYLQGNFTLVRWVVVRVLGYGAAATGLVVAVAYAAYVVPVYGLRLALIFVEFAVAIFAFLVSAAPLYMLKRFVTLAVATVVALGVTLLGAHLLAGSPAGVRHAQLLGLAVGSGAMVVIAVSFLAVRADTDLSTGDPLEAVKPPTLRVVLWHGLPYAVYGFAYFALILSPPLVAGFAYGGFFGVHRFVYPPTLEGAVDIALLELVVLLGLVHASLERFGRRLRPLLTARRLDRWRDARRDLGREWWSSVTVVACASALVAWAAPTVLVAVLPAALTGPVREAGGTAALRVAAVGFALVPVGMLCSQYLFFLSRPAVPVAASVAGALVAMVTAGLLVSGGDLTLAAWGLVAGGAVFAGGTAVASHRALAAGEESFYASF